MGGLTSSSRAWLAGALALFVALAYAPTLGNGFVWDDLLHIAGNRRIESWSAALGYFTDLEGRYYRPAVFFSYALEHSVWGPVAAGFHLTNLLLHLLNTLLLVSAATRSGLSFHAAVFAGAVFGLHPLQTEAVAYVSGRTDLMMTTGALLAWRALLGAGSAWRRGVVAAAATAFALVSKESGYALVLLLPWVAWRRGRGRWQGLTLAGPGLIVAAVLLFLRPGPGPWAEGGAGLGIKVGGVGCALGTYLRLLVWPWDLRVDRLTPLPDSTTASVVGVGLLLVVLVLVVWGLSRRGAAADWTAWSVAFYLPVSNLLALYPAISPQALFTPEHNLYASLAGLAALGGLGADRIRARLPTRSQRLVTGTAILLLVSWGVRSGLRAGDWRDEERLFGQAARAGSRSPRVWYNLGNVLLRRGATAAAAEAFEGALRHAPGDAEIWMNLGVARQKEGLLDSALLAYRRAAALAPDNAQLFENLGTLHLARGDMEEAGEAFALALRLDPQRSRSRQALRSIKALRRRSEPTNR